MGERLGEGARTRSEVRSIEPDGDGHVVGFVDGDEVRRVRARHVIVAAQAPTASRLIAGVAPEASAALARMTYGVFLNVAVLTKETGPMPWDDVYAMATPGRAFDMFTNQAHALRRDRPRRPGGSLMLFGGGHAAAELSGASDDMITTCFLRDLVDLYPEASGIVAEARVQRWPLGNVFARPGRHLLQAPIEGPLGPAANIHLAGDYFAELGNLEMAARTGAAAADRVDAMLTAEPAPPPRELMEAVR
jgi:oxygen-dependent protoporphyrinogen oxidase